MSSWVPVVVAVLACACGKVNPNIDASIADDAVDAEADAPAPQIVTAVSVQGITGFTANLGVFTKVPYLLEQYDDENEYEPTTSRFTAKVAGEYLVCASLSANSPSGMFFFELDIYINSIREKAIGVGENVAHGCRPVRLAAGQHLEIWTSPTESALTFPQNNLFSWLTIARIPEASVAAATTTQFTATDQVFVDVPYTNEVRDELNGYNPTTSLFTAPQAGDYFICGSLSHGDAFAGELDIYKNGARMVGIARQNGGTQGCRGTRAVAGDTLDMQFFQSNGAGNKVIPHNSLWNWMTVHQIPMRLQVNSSTTFTATGGQYTKIPYTGESFDTQGEFDVVTSVFTASAAGDYLVCVAFDTGSNAYLSEVDAYKNGSQLIGLSYGRGQQTGCHILRFAVNDQLELRTYHAAGTVTFAPNAFWHWLQISKVR